MRRRRVPGVVVLVLDSGLTSYARALTPDSGTFSIVGALGRFHLKVMRIGFRPTESRVFSLSRDTTVQLELADIPVVLPRVTTRDRNDCRLHPDTSDAAALTFALWDQARTALLATETRSRNDGYYRICGVPRGKLLLVRAPVETYMVTQTLTLDAQGIVRQLDLRLKP
jgi:hypothetical protein